MGEFSNAMAAGNVETGPQTAFSTQQLQTFATAQAGWFFWSYKLDRTGMVKICGIEKYVFENSVWVCEDEGVRPNGCELLFQNMLMEGWLDE